MSLKKQTRRSKFKNEIEREEARLRSIKKACYKYQLTDKYKEYRQQKYKEKIYNIVKKYMDKREDDIDDLIDEEDTSKIIRNKFKKKYGEKEYNKYLLGK